MTVSPTLMKIKKTIDGAKIVGKKVIGEESHIKRKVVQMLQTKDRGNFYEEIIDAIATKGKATSLEIAEHPTKKIMLQLQHHALKNQQRMRCLSMPYLCCTVLSVTVNISILLLWVKNDWTSLFSFCRHTRTFLFIWPTLIH